MRHARLVNRERVVATTMRSNAVRVCCDAGGGGGRLQQSSKCVASGDKPTLVIGYGSVFKSTHTDRERDAVNSCADVVERWSVEPPACARSQTIKRRVHNILVRYCHQHHNKHAYRYIYIRQTLWPHREALSPHINSIAKKTY